MTGSAGVVQTVLGPVAPADLGVVDCHDHVLIVGGLGVAADPDMRIDDPDCAVAELTTFAQAGGGTVVDCMPLDCGRDPEGLVRVSRASGVHVVAATGFHTPRYYDDLHWTNRYPVEVIADLLVAEVREGMDRYSYSGPIVERMQARPGVVKWATAYQRVDLVSRRIAEAVADCHRRTGIPVLTHAEHGTFLSEQLDLLESLGVPPSGVLLSHVDRNPDHGLHRALAERGAYLVFDGPSRVKYHPESTVIDCIRRLVEAGFAPRVLLGLDHALRSQWTAYGGGPGMAYLLSGFVPRLAAEGIAADAVEEITVRAPARALTFRAT